MEQRLKFLDVARGAGILLVVAAHAGLLKHPAASWIYEFYMPLFFVVAGYLSGRLGTMQTAAACGKRLIHLIRVYFAGSAALFLIWFFMYPVRERNFSQVGRVVGSILCGRMTDPSNGFLLDACWTGPMWFLTLMVTSQVLLFWALKLDSGTSARRILLLTGLLLGAQWLRKTPVLLPWCLDTAPMAAALMLISAWMGQKKILEAPADRRVKAGYLVLIVLFICLHDTYDLHQKYYGQWNDLRGTLAFFLAGLCGSLLFLQICRMLTQWTPVADPFALVGRNSLAVFIGHTFLIWAVDGVFLRLPAFPSAGALRGGIVLLAGVLVPIAGQYAVRFMLRQISCKTEK